MATGRVNIIALDEWGGLRFIIVDNGDGTISCTHVEFEGVQYELVDNSPFRFVGVKV